MKQLVYKLSSIPTLMDSHPCLTRSKEIQNKFLIQIPIYTRSPPHLTRSKESQNNCHTNSCLPTFIDSHLRFNQEQRKSKQLSCIQTLVYNNFHRRSSSFNQKKVKSRQLAYKHLSTNSQQLSSSSDQEQRAKVKTTLMKLFVYQLSSTLILVRPGAKS